MLVRNNFLLNFFNLLLAIPNLMLSISNIIFKLFVYIVFRKILIFFVFLSIYPFAMFLIAMFLYSFYRFSYNTFFNCLILLYPLSCAIVYGYEMAKNTEKEMPKKTDEKPKKDIPKSPDGEGYWVGVVNWSGIVTLFPLFWHLE